jgi:selenocysteine lyase/cysteine desulfurase
MALDINTIRSHTPACENKLFFNNAGSSLMPINVSEVVHNYLKEEEEYGGYYVSDNSKERLQGFYAEAANLLHCQPREVAYTHDATESFSRALSSIPFEKGDCIVTTQLDYTSNQIQYLSLQNRFGIQIYRIGLNDLGDLNIQEASQLIHKHRPKLVAVTHIPTNTGTVQDVYAIGDICSQYDDTIYLVDACQSVGMIDVDVNRMKCDFLSGTGRKFLRGPRGTGFLFVSERILNTKMSPLFIDGRSAVWNKENEYELAKSAKRFETWEASYAGKLGLKAAFAYANEIGIEEIEKYNKDLSLNCRNRLQSIEYVECFDRGSNLSNIITIRKANVSLKEMEKSLSDASVFYSVSTTEWGLIDFKNKGIDWVVRISPHYFNTKTELEQLAQILERV